MSAGLTLGKKLKDFRRIAGGRSQEWLAEKLGLARATINRWETHGAGTATVDQVELIADCIEKSMGELLGIVPGAPVDVENLATMLAEREKRIKELESQLQKTAENLQKTLTPQPLAAVEQQLSAIEGGSTPDRRWLIDYIANTASPIEVENLRKRIERKISIKKSKSRLPKSS